MNLKQEVMVVQLLVKVLKLVFQKMMAQHLQLLVIMQMLLQVAQLH